MEAGAVSNPMTRITLSFMLSLLSDNNYQGPEAPVNSKYHWSYKGPEGPDFWHVHYKYCSGERQSPINIISASCEHDPTMEPIILGNFDAASGATGPCILNVTNNGHAASMRVLNDDMWIQGGGLGSRYKTVEFHLHWGSTDDLGSEHAINGRKYPLEMHVVNFAEKYGTLKQAMNQSDGLAVLGVFFELSENDNPYFAALDDALRHVHKAGEYTIVNQLFLRSLLPEDLTKFWRYNGSLTTPFCFESVVWTVFAEPMKISKQQVTYLARDMKTSMGKFPTDCDMFGHTINTNKTEVMFQPAPKEQYHDRDIKVKNKRLLALETLRSLLHEEFHDIRERGEHRSFAPSRLLENWRPIQPLNGRVVKRSFPDASDGLKLTKPMMETKMMSFGMSLPAMSNFNDASADIVGGANTNADPVNPAVFPPTYTTIQKAAESKLKSVGQSETVAKEDKTQSQSKSQNAQDGQQMVGSKPITMKYVISDSGSGISIENSTDLASNPESHRKSGSSTGSSPPIDESRVSNFGQISYSNLATPSSGVSGSNQNAQGLHFRQTSSNLASKSDLPQSTDGAGLHEKLMASTASELPTVGQSQQGVHPGRSTSESTLNSRSSVTTHLSPPDHHVSSSNHPSIQVISSKPQTTAVKYTPQSTKQRQNYQQQPQHQIISPNMNLNSRVGPMDSRIAELANQIRLHRQHGNAQYSQQNKSQPVINTDNKGLPMPPVIRYNQRGHPAIQSLQNRFYAQSRQHNALQQQRQQILQMNKPPTPQQLRAILEKLAATNRFNAQPKVITSGAASIPRGMPKDANAMSGTLTSNRHQPTAIIVEKSNIPPHVIFNNQHFGRIHASAQAPSTLRSPWPNPSANAGFGNQNVRAPFIPQPYWPHLQHQQLMQNEAYPQEMQRQPQQQFLQQDWAPLSPSIPRNGNSETFFGTGADILPGPYLSSPENVQQHIYLSNIQNPVRIRRPVFEQLSNWHQRQYEAPPLPYFV